MDAQRAMWVRTSNRPDCRRCKQLGRGWLYKLGFQVLARADTCSHCEAEEKAKAVAGLPERFR